MIGTDITTMTLFGRENIKVFADRPGSIKEFFEATVEKYADKEALLMDGDSLTYRQLKEQSTQLAAALQEEYGIQKGERVAALLGNRFEFAVTALACVCSGIILVPVNTKLKPPEAAYILGHSKPKAIICESELLPLVDECRKLEGGEHIPETVVTVGDPAPGGIDFATLTKGNRTLKDPELVETDPAFIMYTSGTTGRPKGAVISHINVIHTVMHYQRAFNSGSDVRTMLAVPFFHITGLAAQFFQCMYIGGSMVIMQKYQNEKYIRDSYNYRVNVQTNVPTIFAMMATSPLLKEYSFDFVNRVGFGGSPIYQHTLEMLMEIFPNATYHNIYGATETTSPTTIMPNEYPMSKAGSVGFPVETGEIKVIDSEGNEAAPGETGELLIKGPMVIGGYWDNPDANRTSFVDGYWRSGDVAKIDEDGFVYILDRKKDMINRGGEKIFSIEVEDVLKKHPGIAEAAVVASPDPIYGERVKAFIASETLGENDIPAIREYCGSHLAKFKIPELFEFLVELPKTASGKVLKHQLRDSKREDGK